MRIAMFLDSCFPPDSRVENEALSLIEGGHEVALFSLCRQNLPSRETVNGIQVYRFPLSKLAYKASALAYDFPLYHFLIKKSIRQFIEQVKPEVLHVHDLLLAKPIINSYKEKYPIVLDLHENRPEIMRFYPHLQRFPSKQLIDLSKWKSAQNKWMRKADYLILVTKEAKQIAIKEANIHPDKVTVVPNNIKKEIFLNYPLDSAILDRWKDRFNIVYVGDTGIRRGTDTAIEAVNLLSEKIPNIQLILVGKSTEDSQLKALVEQLGITSLVHFAGWQGVSLFPSYIKAAEICLSPLHRNLHHDTTYANKIFQYMAMGKAQVVSDCPAQASVIESSQSGLVHRASDAHDLADKIYQLFQNAALRDQLGQNGLLAMEKDWNWDKSKKALLDLYHKI